MSSLLPRFPHTLLTASVCLHFLTCCPQVLAPGHAFSDPRLPSFFSHRSDRLPGQTRAEMSLATGRAGEMPSESAASAEPEKNSRSLSRSEGIRALNREVVRLYQQGNYEEAVKHGLKTCETARHHLGEDDPELEACLSNLALIYKARGQYSQAEPLLKESLEISRRTRGENNPDFVTGLNNLANLYADTGRYSEAETLYLQSLEIIRANAGEANAFMVKGLNNLASLYNRMGNFVAVEPLYAKARDLLASMPGDNQADLAVVLKIGRAHV